MAAPPQSAWAGAAAALIYELRMKRLRLRAESLKLLTEVAEQRSDRDRYLVLSRSSYPSRGARHARSDISQRRANTRQVVGRRLNKLRRGGYKRQRCSFLGNPASDCGTRHATSEAACGGGCNGGESGVVAGPETTVTVRRTAGLSHDWRSLRRGHAIPKGSRSYQGESKTVVPTPLGLFEMNTGFCAKGANPVFSKPPEVTVGPSVAFGVMNVDSAVGFPGAKI
jgi:hypothetical protein